MSWIDSHVDRDPVPVTIELLREYMGRMDRPIPYCVSKRQYDALMAAYEALPEERYP